jgi:hypothetical protein
MKSVYFFAIAFVIQCSFGQAAVFTSTTTFNQSFQRSFVPLTIYNNLLRNTSSSQGYSMSITSGINSANFSADTDADNGYVTSMQFKPIGLPGPTTLSRSLNYQRLVVDVPANFPLPPVTHVENSVFQERLIFDSPTIVTPTLVNSTVDPLAAIGDGSPWFVMDNELTLAPISLVLHGTYEAIGPVSTKSIPFSVSYGVTEGLTTAQRVGVKGGAGFGNGFETKIRENMQLRFRTSTTTVVDEVVDGLRVRLTFPQTFLLQLVQGAPIIPEPSSATLIGITCFALLARFRHRAGAIR